MQATFKVSNFSHSADRVGICYDVSNTSYHLESFQISVNKQPIFDSMKIAFYFSICNKNKKGPYVNEEEVASQKKLSKVFKEALTSTGRDTLVNDYSSAVDLNVFVTGKEWGCRVVDVLGREFRLDSNISSQMKSVIDCGTLPEQLVHEKISSLVTTGKFQEAFNEAALSDKLGFPNALFGLGNHFKALGAIQPAYTAFASIDTKNSHFQRAQYEAGTLCPQVLQAQNKTINEIAECVFNHFLNAGEGGQEKIDQFYAQVACEFSPGNVPAELTQIRTDFNTLTNLAKVIREQNARIRQLETEMAAKHKS